MNKKSQENNLKICAVVCEYNPFHNGHAYQIEEIRARSGCDKVLCLMSGNFVQRGDIAILDKFTRAQHALLAGADCALELPLPFATGNAEIFASGAIAILKKIPAVTTLAFGVERGHAPDILAVARILADEPTTFKTALKNQLDDGQSFAKARSVALKTCLPDMDEGLFSLPNATLGIEYAKAILRQKANIEILPILRQGADYNDENLQENYSSATAIRSSLLNGEFSPLTAKNMPDFVLPDLKSCLSQDDFNRFYDLELLSLVTADKTQIEVTPDCSEGLENRLKNLVNECFTLDEVVRAATSKRYPSARIRRILLANALQITKERVATLKTAPYGKVLGVKQAGADELLNALQAGGLPLLTRKGDEEKLSEKQREIFELSLRADLLYSAVCKRQINPHATLFL